MFDEGRDMSDGEVGGVVVARHAWETFLFAIVGFGNKEVEHATEKRQPGKSSTNRDGLPPLT
jgi:hypothetical protein